MSAIDKLACKLGDNGEVPNQELARELAASGDATAIAEIAGGLMSRDKAVQSDCIKVLYEIGYIKSELIAGFAQDFLRLLSSRSNRMIWGAMIALSTMAPLGCKAIEDQISLIYDAMKVGSVITADNGVKVLAAVAARNPEGSRDITRYLFEHLRTCRAKEVPQHAESTLVAINAANKEEFLSVLKARQDDMSPSQMIRIRKICRTVEKIK